MRRNINIKAGQIWKHYKGGFYKITGLAICEQTKSPLVLYINKDGLLFARKIENFLSILSAGETTHNGTGYRFRIEPNKALFDIERKKE